MRWKQPSLGSFTVGLAALCAAGLLAQERPAPADKATPTKRPAFAKVREPEVRRGLFEDWKATHRSAYSESLEGAAATAVGRASMVINSSNTVFYTRQTPGSSCDVDEDRCGNNNGCPAWSADVDHVAGDIVRGTDFLLRYGLLFQAQNAGTSGGVEPNWPIVAGNTIGDGSVTWKAIGFDPASLSGCVLMQLVARAGGGSETVLATESMALGSGWQLSGWSEFMAANDAGLVALRAEVAGRPKEDDEGTSAILTAGPGAGSASIIADSPVTIGGKRIFGYSAMVAMNNAGQVVFDGYGKERSLNPWAATTFYGAGNRILPNAPNLLMFQVVTAGTTGSSQPVWPATVGSKIVDGTVTWQARAADGDEDNHNLIRHTPGVGNQVLIGYGDVVLPSFTVDGFGDDNFTGAACSGCAYDNFDGRINASGHVPVVITSNGLGGQVAYLLTGPGAHTEAARTGGAGPGGAYGTIYPRINLNDSDQMVFVADVGGVKKILRWTPPSTTVVIAKVGDDLGVLGGGGPSGVTIADIGYFADINSSGNVVFQVTLNGSSDVLGYLFWDGSTGIAPTVATGADYGGGGARVSRERARGGKPAQVQAGSFIGLAAEMITLNDSNLVAFVDGSDSPESTGEASESVETNGVWFWTQSGGVVPVLAVGDSVSGNTVSAIYAQHPSFVKRQLNSNGCVAFRYYVSPQSGDNDEEEGSGGSPLYAGTPPGGQLFSSCGAVCGQPNTPVLTATPSVVGIGQTVKLTWTGVMAAGQGTYRIRRFFDDTEEIIASGIPSTGAPTQTFNYTDSGPLGSQSFEVEAIPTCDPEAESFSNQPSITLTNCIKPPPPPHLIINSSILPVGAVAALLWDPPFSGFAGKYEVLFSTDNGATFSPFTGPLSNNHYSFTVQFAVGSTVIFEVVADAGCGAPGLSAPSPTVSLQTVQECPPVAEPVAQVDKPLVAVGDPWSLHWTPTLPSGLGGPAGTYEVRISEDYGVSYQVAGTTQNPSFTGPPVPQSDSGKIVFLQVVAKPSCATGTVSAGFSNVVFFVVVPGCEAPEAASNALIQAASPDGTPVDRPPFPTEPLSLSWNAPTSGTPPTGYMIRVNGDTPGFVSGGTATIAPARGDGNPVTLYVTSEACNPQKPGPTIQSPTVALLTEAPGASFTISPNPRVGQPVTFTDTSSPQATSWLWLFDDGTQSTDQSPSITFSAPGTHAAALVATNGAGSGAAVQSFLVSAASSTVTVTPSSETIGFTVSQPGRRRVSVDVERPGAVWLQLSSQADQDTTLFLRFSDEAGNLLAERRLVVAKGASATHDLAAYGLRGVFSIELVGDTSVEATVVRTGRSTREVRR